MDPVDPAIHADDLGLTRGDGCFEGCRIRRLGAEVQVDDLDSHLGRMAASADGLGIEFEVSAWRALIDLAVDEWNRCRPCCQEAGLKLVLTRGRESSRGPTGFASISALPESVAAARRDGVAVVTLARGLRSDAFSDSPWMLGGVKTLSYAVNMAAHREAARRGAEDAIFVSSDGQILEATTAAIVWVNGIRVSTVPSGDNGILASITTERLLDELGGAGFTPCRAPGTVADLRGADAVMLVSSVRGPVRVHTIDGQPLPLAEAGVRALSAGRELLGFPAPMSWPT